MLLCIYRKEVEKMLESILKIKINDIVSKNYGRRNYVIYTYDNTATLYGWGQAKRKGILDATSLKDIKEHHIYWFEFTYKEDAQKALIALAQSGYDARYGN
jgi:hypothetical protein